MRVRKYEDRDRERVEYICRVTDNSHLDDDLLLALYCHYYITYEKDNCFVAEVDGTVVGYIISSEDSKKWREGFLSFLSSYREEIREAGYYSTKGYEPFYSQYPAHLHIDIDPNYQRMGIGGALMDALLAHYREKGVKGVMLGVDTNNIKGVSFYKKYGFTPLSENGVWLGIKP